MGANNARKNFCIDENREIIYTCEVWKPKFANYFVGICSLVIIPAIVTFIALLLYFCVPLLLNDFVNINYGWYWLVTFIIFIIIIILLCRFNRLSLICINLETTFHNLVLFPSCRPCKRKQQASLKRVRSSLGRPNKRGENSDMTLDDENKLQNPEKEEHILDSIHFEHDRQESFSNCKAKDEAAISLQFSNVESISNFIDSHQLVTTTPTAVIRTTSYTEALESPRRRLTPRKEFSKEFLFDKKLKEKTEQIVEEKKYFTAANIPSKGPVLVAETFIAINDCSVDKSETVQEWFVDEEKYSLLPNFSNEEIHDDDVFE